MNTELNDDEAYSPTTQGVYTWPIEGETGYYAVLYAGPLPPLQCSSSVPPGTRYEGCFVDSSSSRLFNSPYLELPEQGPNGMTTQVREHMNTLVVRRRRISYFLERCGVEGGGWGERYRGTTTPRRTQGAHYCNMAISGHRDDGLMTTHEV